jgi:hypothetical protein
MLGPKKTWRDYPNNSWIFLMHDNPLLLKIARFSRTIGILPRGFAENMLARDPAESRQQSQKIL